MPGKMSLRTDSHLEKFSSEVDKNWRKYADRYLTDETEEISDAAKKAFEYGAHTGRGLTEVILREVDDVASGLLFGFKNNKLVAYFTDKVQAEIAEASGVVDRILSIDEYVK
jgi:hypothetical protein